MEANETKTTGSGQRAGKAGEFVIGEDLSVTRLGFGAMRITGKGVWGEPADRAEAIRVLRRAVELGINFIDTADSYGPNVSEEIISEALHPYQLHRIDPKVPAEDQLGTLKELQAQGKIKHIGLSEVSVAQIQRARKIVPIVSVQNRYSVTDRGAESVLEYCEKEKMAFIPWFPLAAGKVSGANSPIGHVAARLHASPSQLALAWLLARSSVMLPIPGTSKVAHLEENIAAAGLELSSDDMRELDGMAQAS
jgi:aryl-alcohol dehydrogenase-like predicted oxidoreductase